MSKAKILLWDLETSHNIVAAFQLFDARISHQAIYQERYIICASYKWLGQKKVHGVSVLDDPKRFKKDHTDDYHVVKTMHDIISQADAICAHYGDKFDIKYLNTRVLYHGLKPLPPVIQVDTYKMAKQKFLFNCNRLDYIGQYLGVGRKISTSLDLWLKCLDGDEKAIKYMLKYNKQDVRLLEDVYKILEPYCNTKVNRQLIGNADRIICPTCESENVVKQGHRYTSRGKVQQYQCLDCGKWASGNKHIIA